MKKFTDKKGGLKIGHYYMAKSEIFRDMFAFKVEAIDNSLSTPFNYEVVCYIEVHDGERINQSEAEHLCFYKYDSKEMRDDYEIWEAKSKEELIRMYLMETI